MILYKTFIQPHLEYCVQVWSPRLRKYINTLERIQARATKLVPELRHLTYDERLHRLDLTTLGKRRLRGDLIETYEILSGKESIDSAKFFTLNDGLHNLRGHRYKLFKDRSRLNVRKFFFSQRVVDSWNKLPAHVVEAETVNCLKRRLWQMFELGHLKRQLLQPDIIKVKVNSWWPWTGQTAGQQDMVKHYASVVDYAHADA